MSEETSFRESRIYPVIFMVIITVFFVGLLAFFYHSTRQKVEDHQKYVFHETILSAFNLPTDRVEEDYKAFITEIKDEKNNMMYYKAQQDNRPIGFAFVVYGKGLWGSIKALLAVQTDMNTIINISIIEQSETPGLGARITEEWFLKQFNGKSVLINQQSNPFRIVSENEKMVKEDEIKGITGATLSTKAITTMINSEMNKIINTLKVNHE